MFSPRSRRTATALAAALLASSVGVVLLGQGGRPSRSAFDFATPESFDGSFQFCRVAYRQAANGDGARWDVDYPRADQNLSIRLSELTKAPVSFDDRKDPNHLLIQLAQPELFRCPFIMMTEVGAAYLDDLEAANLRDYLLKGGFLWADDFWGEYAWAIWESQIRKALPSSAFPIVDIPLNHQLFHQVIEMHRFPQIPSIGFWSGGDNTSERGADSATPHARGILDEHGHLMVLMTHNTDFGDAFEREGDNHEYFERFSIDGYAFGINALIYAMTH
jgi:hypothetical protein